MTREQWKKKQSKPKYTGYKVGYHTFSWKGVESISKVYVNTNNPKRPVVRYFINFFSGKQLDISGEIEPIMIEAKGLFGQTYTSYETDSDVYFEQSKDVQEAKNSRERAVRAYYKYIRSVL